MDDNEEKIIGAGTFSMYSDFFGNPNAIINQIMTYKEDSFKKGIEEAIMRELFKYLKKTLNIKKTGFFLREKDNQYAQVRSVLMKLGFLKSNFTLYELDI
jgi:hypothetical protein